LQAIREPAGIIEIREKDYDTAGRVERFRRKFAKSDAGKAETAAK